MIALPDGQPFRRSECASSAVFYSFPVPYNFLGVVGTASRCPRAIAFTPER